MASEYTPVGFATAFTVPDYADVADGPKLAKDLADDIAAQFSYDSKTETLTNKTIGSAALSGPLNAAGFNILNVPTPTVASSAANKNYVDTAGTSQVALATAQAVAAAASAATSTGAAATSTARRDEVLTKYLGAYASDAAASAQPGVTTGTLYFNTTLSEMRVRQVAGTWTSANQPQLIGDYTILDDITFNGVAKSYVAKSQGAVVSLTSKYRLLLYINGILVTPGNLDEEVNLAFMPLVKKPFKGFIVNGSGGLTFSKVYVPGTNFFGRVIPGAGTYIPPSSSAFDSLALALGA